MPNNNNVSVSVNGAMDEIENTMENVASRSTSEENDETRNQNEAIVEPVISPINVVSSGRPVNAIEFDYHHADYVETQSLGIEHSGGLFWICNAFTMYGRQMDASSSGLILLLGHGLQFIWALNTMRRHHDRQEVPSMLSKAAILIYYVGAFVGTLIGVCVVKSLKKRVIYNIGVGLTLLTSVLFMAAEWHPETLIPGRIVAGFSYGLIYFVTLIHTSETASNEFRHFVVLNIGFTFGLSILVVAVISLSSYNVEGLQGNAAITTLIYGIIAFINNYFSTQESPIFLLQKQTDDTEVATIEAYETFRVLQKRRMTCMEMQRRFLQLKAYVMDERQYSTNILDGNNMRAILLGTCIRLTTCLSFNLGICFVAINMEQLIFSNDESHMLRITFLCWFVCGTLTIFITYKIRNCLYLAALAFGIVATVNVIALIVFIDIFKYVLAAVLGAYVLCASLPLEILGGIYISEAFPLSKKPLSMAFALCVEFAAHILLTLFVLQQMFIPFWFLTSLSLIGLGFKLSWSIPQDTHKMTLQQSAMAFGSATAREWYTRANVNSRCP